MKKNSLKVNVILSYFSQIYLIVVSLLVLPIYIKFMGAEAYGLVGFFAMLQGLFNLLDFGLTPTISRQASQYNSGLMSALNFRQLFRSLSIIFCIIAILGGGVIFYFDSYIAMKWLKLETLDFGDVVFCIQVMAICVSLKWITGLFRGVISGFEHIAWLSLANIAITTLKFPSVLIYMYFMGFTIKSFFVFQLVIAVFEFIIFACYTFNLLPQLKHKEKIGWSLKPIQSILNFALTIAITSSIWVALTQLDKFILSGILQLSEYAYFTLAVLVAGGILQISTPISAAIMPRMARLYGEKKYREVTNVYLYSTQFITVIVVTAGLVLTALAKPTLYLWTGNIFLAEKTAPILQLYALGNTVLVLGAFPYYLQYARGNLKYHFIGNLGLAIVLIPTIIWGAKSYGALGAGWVWLSLQIFYLLFWVSFTHLKLEPNLNKKWFKSFIPSIINVIIVLGLFYYFMDFSSNRPVVFIQICIISIVCLFVSAMSCMQVRNFLKIKLFQEKI